MSGVRTERKRALIAPVRVTATNRASSACQLVVKFEQPSTTKRPQMPTLGSVAQQCDSHGKRLEEQMHRILGDT